MESVTSRASTLGYAVCTAPWLYSTKRSAHFAKIGKEISGRETEGVIGVYDKNQQLIGYLNKSGQLQSAPQPFTTRVYTMFQDKKGRMWIGTKLDGLYCLDGGKVLHFLHDAKNKWSLSCNDVYDIFQDKMGRIWIATYEGGLNLVMEDGKGGMSLSIIPTC